MKSDGALIIAILSLFNRGSARVIRYRLQKII